MMPSDRHLLAVWILVGLGFAPQLRSEDAAVQGWLGSDRTQAGEKRSKRIPTETPRKVSEETPVEVTTLQLGLDPEAYLEKPLTVQVQVWPGFVSRGPKCSLQIRTPRGKGTPVSFGLSWKLAVEWADYSDPWRGERDPLMVLLSGRLVGVSPGGDRSFQVSRIQVLEAGGQRGVTFPREKPRDSKAPLAMQDVNQAPEAYRNQRLSFGASLIVGYVRRGSIFELQVKKVNGHRPAGLNFQTSRSIALQWAEVETSNRQTQVTLHGTLAKVNTVGRSLFMVDEIDVLDAKGKVTKKVPYQ